MWQTKYASAVPINLGLGFDFLPCSEKHFNCSSHGLRTSGDEIAFTARPKIKSQSQIYRYGRSILCLPHRPKISGFFDLCLHRVSVVRVSAHQSLPAVATNVQFTQCRVQWTLKNYQSWIPTYLKLFQNCLTRKYFHLYIVPTYFAQSLPA